MHISAYRELGLVTLTLFFETMSLTKPGTHCLASVGPALHKILPVSFVAVGLHAHATMPVFYVVM